MAALTKVRASTSGATYALTAAAAGGDTFDNEGDTVFHAKNASVSTITVTVDSTHLCNQGSDHNLVISLLAGTEQIIGPFPIVRFGRTVSVTYSGVTSLTVAAVAGA